MKVEQFANEGWAAPTPPPPLFEAVQGCLKAHGLWFLLKPIMRTLCLQMGGGAAPLPTPSAVLGRAS